MATQGNGGPQPNPHGPQAPLPQQIADFMKKLVKKSSHGLSEDEIEDIFEDVKDNYFNQDPKSTVLQGPMLQDPKFHAIKCTRRLKNVIEHIETAISTGNFPANSPIKPKLESIFALWTSACSLKQIDRYLSLDQAPLNSTPLEDGSNLSQASVNPSGQITFEMEYLLRKLTIAFLHLPYDPSNPQFPRQGFVDQRLVGLRRLYFAARLLLQQEFRRIKADKKDDYAHNLPVATSAVNWVRNSKKNIVSALESVALLACHRPADPTEEELLDQKIREMNQGNEEPMGEEEEREIRAVLRKYGVEKSTSEKIDDNFKEQGLPFLDVLIREMKVRLVEETHLDPLLMDLIRREDEFEAKLAVEHYEDKLVTKQFSLLDEQSFAEHRKWEPEFSIEFLNDLFDPTPEGQQKHVYRELEDTVFKIFQDMGLVNRHRRNFRLLRDWIGKRPWKQIYQLYDSTNPAEPEWVREGIAEFHKKAILPFKDDDNTTPAPSSYDNVVPQLFGFLPIDTAKCSKTKYGCDLRREKCVLCKKRYYGGFSEDPKGFCSTIVELHCKAAHKFHLKCIFNYWDARGKYLHSCPTCGDMAKLNYETVGLNPAHGTFAHNNQNYETAARVATYLHSDHPVLAKKARELYDVPPVPLFPRQRGDDPMDLDMFPNPPATAVGRAYYESEIQYHAAVREMPVFWRSGFFPPGEPTSTQFSRPQPTNAPPTISTLAEVNLLNPFDLQANMDSSRQVAARDASDRIAKATGDMLLQREFDRGRMDVYDVEGERVLPGARLAPAMEAAMLRGRRRRREFKRREEMRKGRKGLEGLK
ncbi:hypothetical protein DL98DRAFT_573191 [Cadophora sp. DSE1049]|nr:hypothetical protein DL98DRAFT_573191 [Cadophora sp. DSE1049]